MENETVVPKGQRLRFRQLAYCDVGEVKSLSTCNQCAKIVRVHVVGTAIVMRRHRCAMSGTAEFTNRVYSLQQRVKVTRRGERKLRLVWVLV